MSKSVNGSAADGGGDSESAMPVAALESVDAFCRRSRERMRGAKGEKLRG
jgi:hypothetical protein